MLSLSQHGSHIGWQFLLIPNTILHTTKRDSRGTYLEVLVYLLEVIIWEHDLRLL